MQPKILALSANARVGKDTFFKALKLVYPELKIKRFAFADAVKDDLAEEIKDTYGFSVYTQDSEQKKQIRPRLIEHGEGSKIANPTIWVDKVFNSIAESDCDLAVITDIRYPIELEHTRLHGGKIIHLERDGIGPGSDLEREHIPTIAKQADWTFKIDTVESNPTKAMAIQLFDWEHKKELTW